MVRLRVTKIEYEDFLHKSVGTNNEPSLKELRFVNRVLDILEEKATPPPQDDTGRFTADGWKLIGDEAIFEVSGDQAAYIRTRLIEYAKTTQNWRAREILPMIDQLTPKDHEEE